MRRGFGIVIIVLFSVRRHVARSARVESAGRQDPDVARPGGRRDHGDLVGRLLRGRDESGGRPPGHRGLLPLVPDSGVHHCAGGPGLTDFDALTLLEHWVEKGQAPDVLIARRPANGIVERSRPIYPIRSWRATPGAAIPHKPRASRRSIRPGGEPGHFVAGAAASAPGQLSTTAIGSDGEPVDDGLEPIRKRPSLDHPERSSYDRNEVDT